MNTLALLDQQREWLIKHCHCTPCKANVSMETTPELWTLCRQIHHVTNKRSHRQLKHIPRKLSLVEPPSDTR